MSKQNVGPFICETDNLGVQHQSIGTATIVSSNTVVINDDNDVDAIYPGTVIRLAVDPDNEYRVIMINGATKTATFHRSISGAGGTGTFTYWRMPFAVRAREEYSGGYNEHLRAYMKENGLYQVDESSLSCCILGGKNSSPQVLTSGARTLVQWDSSLVWINPQDEWGDEGDSPNFFVPLESGYYSVDVNFSIVATNSITGNLVSGFVSLDGWSSEYIEVTHQRSDLTGVSTYMQNINMQCIALMAAGQKLGIYVTSECAVSEISNIHTMHLSIWQLGISYVWTPGCASGECGIPNFILQK